MGFVRGKLSKSLTSRFLRTMKKKRPVLQDVADRVGVTKMTVSRFLRNPEQVSVALRGKIAAALMNWVISPTARPIFSPMRPAARWAFCFLL